MIANVAYRQQFTAMENNVATNVKKEQDVLYPAPH